MQLTAEEQELLAEYNALHQQQERAMRGALIYYFGKYDPALDAAHPMLKLKGPNPLQQKLLDAWLNLAYKVFTFTGGNRIGKTTIGTIIALCVLFGKWPWSNAEIAFPHTLPRKIRYVGQDWEKHIKAVVEPELAKWWPKDRKLKTKKNNQGVDALWTDVASGSTLEIMSNNQEASLHEGWSGDLIVYDEPPKRDIRVANARGLVDRKGRELFCMTLLQEPWIHREVIKMLDENGEPDLSVFNVDGDIWQNVGFGLTEEGVDQFAKTLKPEEKEARLHGKPSYLTGLIFPRFNRQIHVRKSFTVPLDWVVDIAIDWHPSKAWAITFVATDNLNRKWVVDEIFEKGNFKYIGEEIIRRIRKHDYRVEHIIVDPLMKSGSQSDIEEQTVFDKLGDVMFQYGYTLETASKDQNSGIDLINEFLMTESEEPAFFVFQNCSISIQHMEDWMWKDGKPATDGEDMCENIYRIMLLDTHWFPVARRKTDGPSRVSWRTT